MLENYYGNNKLYYVLGNYITKPFTVVIKSSAVNAVPLQPRNRGYAVEKRHMIKAQT